jgi:hypothetical protein
MECVNKSILSWIKIIYIGSVSWKKYKVGKFYKVEKLEIAIKSLNIVSFLPFIHHLYRHQKFKKLHIREGTVMSN